MKNFESKALKRTFPTILFGSLAGANPGAAGTPGGMMMGGAAPGGMMMGGGAMSGAPAGPSGDQECFGYGVLNYSRQEVGRCK